MVLVLFSPGRHAHTQTCLVLTRIVGLPDLRAEVVGRQRVLLLLHAHAPLLLGEAGGHLGGQRSALEWNLKKPEKIDHQHSSHSYFIILCVTRGYQRTGPYSTRPLQ